MPNDLPRAERNSSISQGEVLGHFSHLLWEKGFFYHSSTKSLLLFLSPRSRNTISLSLQGIFISHISRGNLYWTSRTLFQRLGGGGGGDREDGRPLGGPVDWKTLQPPWQKVGAWLYLRCSYNMATGSLEA